MSPSNGSRLMWQDWNLGTSIQRNCSGNPLLPLSATKLVWRVWPVLGSSRRCWTKYRYFTYSCGAIRSSVIQCRSASGTWHLRLDSIDKEYSRVQDATWQCRPLHHQREHGRGIFRARAPVCSWCCRKSENHYKSKVWTHCQICFQFRACQPSKKSDMHPQGQYNEISRWFVPRHIP